ncbi:YoaK family protein [Fructobacillus fructosus]|uniref:YoaK family protein n=1 Tax=Fructobacillus fructosus TaxID=1631 RepID=UPI002DAD4497|nr:UPF0700 family (YoaK) [Fructobacillus fructosus]CAK1237045.1 UPF0700 family (YoaK) [Fructobacillus fructosus]CAK1238290.1 UPF0700 family (YoaK) [Fructobacillus fructosus]
MTKNQFPSHERVLFASLLTMTAGSIDAFSYHMHGQVFAGLQTGNIILMGINASQFHWMNVGQYAFSILSFVFGTVIVKVMQHYRMMRGFSLNKERQYVLLYITMLLTLSALIGQAIPNIFGSAILSIAAAAALQEFRVLKGKPFMPLLMTGNLRSLCEATYEGTILRDRIMRERAIDLGLIIFAFFIGAFFISLLLPLVRGSAILFPAILTCMMSRIVHWD